MKQRKEPHRRPSRVRLLLTTVGVPPSRARLLLATMGVVISFIFGIVLIGYLWGWAGKWLVENADFPKKTVWDLLKLLIVPVVIAGVGIIGGAWFTRQRAQETALQTYLDKMSELLIDDQLHKKDNRYDPTRVTARARTLTILIQLDGKRKKIVLQFLRESRLINKEKVNLENVTIPPSLVGLRGADLSNAQLRDMKLISTDRKESVSLEGAFLQGANLRSVDLGGADLREADLTYADLSGANLRGADLTDADLRGANLRKVKLGVDDRIDERNRKRRETPTDLSRADLRRADLRGATEYLRSGSKRQITRGWLKGKSKLLAGATMPDGTKHE